MVTTNDYDNDFLSAMAERRVFIRDTNRFRYSNRLPVYIGQDATSERLYEVAWTFAVNNHPFEECRCRTCFGIGPHNCETCKDRLATFMSVFYIEIRVERERQFNMLLDEQREEVRRAYANASPVSPPPAEDPDIVPQEGADVKHFDFSKAFEDDESDGEVGVDASSARQRDMPMPKTEEEFAGLWPIIMRELEKFKSVMSDTSVMDLKNKKTCRILEALFYLILVDIPRAKSLTQMGLDAYRFVSMITGMCSVEMFTWVQDYCQEGKIDTQAGDPDEVPILEDTNRFFNGSAMKHFKKFFFALTAIGIGKIMDVNMDKTMFETIWTSIANCFRMNDAIVAIFEFMIWLVKNIKGFFSGKKTIKSIFLDANEAQDFDKRMACLASTYELLKIGHEDAVHVTEFSFELDTLELLAERELQKAKDIKGLRIVIGRQLETIKRYKTDLQILLTQQPLREAPYAVLLYGGSGVAKSALGAIITPVLQSAIGVPMGPQYVFNWEPGEKYASGYTGTVNTIQLDDLANMTDPTMGTTTAPELIVLIMNNFKRKANMANLEDKGKISIKPVLVVSSTNAEQFQSGLSVCPVSILRRFHHHLEVKVKDCCATDKMFKLVDHEPADHAYDCWEIDVYHWIPKPDDPKNGMKVFDLQNVSLAEALMFLAKQAKAYSAKQKKLVKYMNNIHKQPICEHMIFTHICPTCLAVKAESVRVEGLMQERNVQDGIVELDTQAGIWDDLCVKSRDKLDQIREFDAKSRMMSKINHKIDNSVGWYKATKVYVAIKDIRDHPLTLRQVYTAFFTCFGVTSMCFLLSASLLAAVGCITATAVSTTVCTTVLRFGHTMKMTVPETLSAASTIARRSLNRAIEEYTPLLLIITSCSALYAVYRSKMTVQGSKPSIPKVTGVMNAYDPYRHVVIESIDRNVNTLTSTPMDLAELLKKNMHVAYFSGFESGKEAWCMATPVCSGKWIMPYHMLKRNPKQVTMIRADAMHLNDRRSAYLDGAWERIGTSDMCVVDLPIMGDRRDFRSMYFSTASGKIFETKSLGGLLVWGKPSIKKHPENTEKEYVHLDKGIQKVNIRTGNIKIDSLDEPYYGGYHVSDFVTFEGMCGAPVITDTTGCVLAGFHAAGKTDTNIAVFCHVSREEVQCAIDKLNGRGAHVQMCESGDFASKLDFVGTAFGHTYAERPRSTSSYIAGNYYHLGWNTAPKRKFTTTVEETKIAPAVCERFGVDIQHEAPKLMNTYVPFNVFMAASANPSDVPYTVLDAATDDYAGKIHRYWDEHPEHKWGDRLHPLAHEAVLAGADGVKGCYSLNLGTSMGIPWTKPKRNYITESEEIVDGISRPLQVDAAMMRLIDQAEIDMMNGQRQYFPHRCNLKNEPVTKGKNKVRVFMGANFVYTYHMRKYFLTASMLVQEYPELFESAVGVNCHSKQWTRLHDHIFKNGQDRCIAGDYTKYDQKFCIKVTLASFKVIMSMLKRAGYTMEQMMLCTVLMTETALAVYDVNGEWVMFASVNPSGHSMTVVINGIGNSLYMRCGYYMLKPPGETRKFSEVVSLMTYGDDNVMSVVKGADWFNHTTLQYVMGIFNMGYTMADKGAESVPYIHKDQCSFLKRTWVWSEEFGRHLCPIEELSIFKSLTVMKVSKQLTESQQQAELVNNANREFFFYGKERFEDSHTKLLAIAEEFGLTHHMPNGHLMNYSEMSEWYKAIE